MFREPAGKLEDFVFSSGYMPSGGTTFSLAARRKGEGAKAGTALSFLPQEAFEISVGLARERKGQTHHLHWRLAP